MTEEMKKEEEAQPGSGLPSVMVKVVLGLAFLTLGVWVLLNWFDSFKILIQGSLGIFFLLVGVVILVMAKE